MWARSKRANYDHVSTILIKFDKFCTLYKSSKVAVISYTGIEQTGTASFVCETAGNLTEGVKSLQIWRSQKSASIVVLHDLFSKSHSTCRKDSRGKEHQHQAQCRQCQKCWAMNDIEWYLESRAKPQNPDVMELAPNDPHCTLTRACQRQRQDWVGLGLEIKRLLHANALPAVCEIYFVCYLNVKFKLATCLLPCQNSWLNALHPPCDWPHLTMQKVVHHGYNSIWRTKGGYQQLPSPNQPWFRDSTESWNGVYRPAKSFKVQD